MTRPEIETRSPEPLANAQINEPLFKKMLLTNYSLTNIYIYIYIYIYGGGVEYQC